MNTIEKVLLLSVVVNCADRSAPIVSGMLNLIASLNLYNFFFLKIMLATRF